MIPKERGIEGLSIYFIFYLTIFILMENNSYMSFLGGRPSGSLTPRIT
jgi:hypothetical protein